MIEITQSFYMNTNILDATEEVFLEAQEDYERNRILDLYTEATILFDAYTNGALVLEDAKIGATNKPIEQKLIKGSMDRLSNYFKKILNFLKGLLDKFLESMSNIFKENNEWLNDNMHYLTKMPKEVVDSLSITCIPYWNNKAHEHFAEDKLPFTNKFANASIANILDEIGKIKDQSQHEESEVYRTFFEPLYKLNAENIKKGAFIYYRGGEPASNKFEGTNAVNAISVMCAFIGKTAEYTNMIKANQNRLTKQIEQLEKELEQYQKQGKELGTGEENLPTMNGQGKINNPAGSTKAVEDSYFYEFEGESLYSDIEGKSLYETEFCNMMFDTYGNSIVVEKSILPNSLRRVFAKNKREINISPKEGKETYRNAIKILDQLIKADSYFSKCSKVTSCDPKEEEKRFDSKEKRNHRLYILPQKIYLSSYGNIDKTVEEKAKKIAMTATRQLGNKNFYIGAFINWDTDPSTGNDVNCIEFTLFENEYLDKDSDLIEYIGYESYQYIKEDAAVAQPSGNAQQQQTQNQNPPKPEMKPMDHQQNKVINQQRQENSHSQTSTNAAIKFCKMCGTVFSVKLSVFREITDHYTLTLKQVVNAVKEYQGVKDEETENKNYNEQQRKNKDRLAEDLVADNIQRRRIRNANKGTVRRWVSNLFGK